MTNSQLIEELEKFSSCIEYKEKEDNKDYYCFTYESMDKTNALHGYQQELSDLIHGADVSHDYAYEWLNDTILTLIDIGKCRNPNDELDRDSLLDGLYEGLQEEFYAYKINEFVASNAWALDEALKEFGAQEDNNLGMAYRYAQEQQCHSFANSLISSIEEDGE